MNSFQRFIEGLDWGEETLLEQRERLAKSVLSEKEMQEREKMKIKKENKQLELF